MDAARAFDIRPTLTPAQTTRQLQGLFPPRAAIVVGASRSHRHLLDWPGVRPEHILLVDAQPEALADIRQKVATAEAWQMRQAVLADSERQAGFFCASNPGEGGLVPPHKLVELWPNLRTTDERACVTQTLHGLLADPELAGLAETRDTWLVVDCLPALRILQGAGPLLEHCKVLWLRVLLEPLRDDEPDTTLEEAERYLTERHFRLIQCIEENHPRIGQAVFLRDDGVRHEREIARLQTACNTLKAEKTSLLDEREALRAEKDALLTERNALHQDKTRLAAERVSLIQSQADLARERDGLRWQNGEITAVCDALRMEKSTLLAEHKALQQSKAALAAERDALSEQQAALIEVRNQQAKLATIRHVQLKTLAREKAELLATCDTLAQEKSALAKARDEQIRLAREGQAQLQALVKEKSELATKLEAQSKQAAEQAARIEVLSAQFAEQQGQASSLATSHDSQTQAIAKLNERIRQLESDLQESHARLRLIQDELNKSEVQMH